MINKIVTLILIASLLFPISAYILSTDNDLGEDDIKKAEEFYEESTVLNAPQKKEDGSKYVIGYIDIDPYPETGSMLYYFITGLIETGWIAYEGELPFEAADTDAGALIDFLADQDLGEYISFSRDANYYVAIDGEDKCMEGLEANRKNREIDLLICMGTSPAVLAVNEMNISDIPIMVMGSIDPVGAGLSKDEEYSGKNNVWCHINFDVYINQMQYYHDSYPFQNIGVVYYSETIAGMNAYRSAADRIGFKITEKQIETLTSQKGSKKEKAYYKKLEAAYRELVEEGIDAFLINTDIIKDDSRIASLLSVFSENGIPVFVQNGEYYVENGALMIVTATDAKVQAPFLSNVFGRILKGEQPGSINQKFVTPPYLSLNLQVAHELGYEVKEEMVLSAEKLYNRIKQ